MTPNTSASSCGGIRRRLSVRPSIASCPDGRRLAGLNFQGHQLEFFGEDPQAAADFYSAVFDWKVSQWGEEPYFLLATGEESPRIDGATAGPQEHGQKMMLTIAVEDLDAASDKVVAAGGTVLVERVAVPTVGWLIKAADPNGVVIGIIEPDPNAA